MIINTSTHGGGGCGNEDDDSDNYEILFTVPLSPLKSTVLIH
jgi:hypothetical protein